jgi:hypothetical protein
MATRSTIAIQLENGSINQVYCHWDGYLENNGKILQTYYNNAEIIKELISKGSISILDININPSKDSKHDFNNKQNDVCVFYHRDRDEDLDIDTFKNFQDYTLNGNFEEFNYIFSEKDNTWYYFEDNIIDLQILSDKLIELDIIKK